jgi:glycosyltransferase involved in cell wall biosynthesis
LNNHPSKRKILFASVLKPIDDTRMFEKLGMSLNKAGGHEVFIVGYPSKEEPQETDSLYFFQHKRFDRISFQRLIVPFKVLKICYQVKPEVLIVNSSELLIVSVLNRILFGTKIIYDIQENYWRNILQTNAFPKLLRPFLASWVRLNEKATSPLFHWNLLAEKGYEKELNFLGKKYTVLENKLKLPIDFKRKPIPQKTTLLFSGTLAKSTGIFEAIELAKSLHRLDSTIELSIIGYCSLPLILSDIKAAIKNHSFITLLGGDTLVPHHEILEAIATADFGLIAYRISPHLENSTPTKLYEYLGCQLPILLQAHRPWVEMCKPYQASINIEYSNPDAERIIQQMRSSSFYTSPPSDVTWESEEIKLLNVIDRLF